MLVASIENASRASDPKPAAKALPPKTQLQRSLKIRSMPPSYGVSPHAAIQGGLEERGASMVMTRTKSEHFVRGHDELTRYYYDELSAFVMSRLRRPNEVSEIVQEVFARVSAKASLRSRIPGCMILRRMRLSLMTSLAGSHGQD